jgi:hypothetical protein
MALGAERCPMTFIHPLASAEIIYSAVFGGHGSEASYLSLNARHAIRGIAGPEYAAYPRKLARSVFTEDRRRWYATISCFSGKETTT